MKGKVAAFTPGCLPYILNKERRDHLNSGYENIKG
jgi:hypothetical protein